MRLTLCLVLLLSATLASAQTPQQRLASFNVDKSGIALKGYDPVSYQQGKPAKGVEQFAAAHDGIRYLFATAANRDAFKADPAKFEPAYGGWCAYAMLEGDKVDINPERFKVVDGHTLVYYDGLLGNTLKKWNKLAAEQPEAELVRKADTHWSALAGK